MGTVNDYFLGTVTQLIERAKHLNGRIPTARELQSPHAQTLVQAWRHAVTTLIERQSVTLEAPEMHLTDNQGDRLRKLQWAVDDLDTIERLGMAALQRWTADDERLTRLVHAIACEINYPLTPPVVSSLSHDYFQIYPPLNL